MLASSGERIPPWGVPVIVSLFRPLFGQDPGPQERLHPAQHTFVPDAPTHPLYQSRVVDLVETRRDIGLEHPLVIAGR